MTTPQVFLPIDVTGSDPANFISSEYHQAPGDGQAIIRPDFGSFFSTGFQLYGVSGANNLTLMRHGVDYVFGHLNESASIASGKAVYQVVLVKNTQFFTTFSLNYHAFGGQVDGINYARLYNSYLQARSGKLTPYANLTGVPSLFPPEHHLHDVKDVFGMEFIDNFLESIKDAVTKNRTHSAKYTDVRFKLREFESERKLSDRQLPLAIRAHIDNTGFPHPYTKASVGLGNVSNFAFVELTVDGNTLPAYASPATITYWLEHQPAPDTFTHPADHSNPHEVDKEQIELGLVQNLGIAINYTAGDYLTLFNPASTELYMGPAAFAMGMAEYGTVTYVSNTQPLVDAALAQATTRLSTASGIMGATAALQVSIDALMASFQSGTTTIQTNSQAAQEANENYLLLYGNAVYCDTAVKIMEYDHMRYASGQSVYDDGYMPVPSLFDGLEFWVASWNPMNVLFADIQGHLRVTHLNDMSPKGRVFTAAANTAPILQVSDDVVNAVDGISEAKVFSFGPGLCWDQSKGPALRIKPGMTIITLVRTGPLASRLCLLSAPNAVNDTGIYAFDESSRSLNILSGGSWRPLEAPAGSAREQVSGIVAGVVSQGSEGRCWLASTSAIDFANYPRGVTLNNTAWPANAYQGAALTRIGNANYGVQNVGEIAEIIMYNRALYATEIKAIVKYLKLRYSANQALSVDYSALNAFN